MIKKIALSILIMTRLLGAQNPIVIHLEKNGQEIGMRAFDLFNEELKIAQKSNKTPVFILPTGSTPIPFYEHLVHTFFQGNLDLSEVIFFNMDEYARLSQQDPKSYAFYMNSHLYHYITPGLTREKVEYFGFKTLTKDQCSNNKYRESLNAALNEFIDALLKLNEPSLEILSKMDTLVRTMAQENRAFKLLESVYMDDAILPSIMSLKSLIEQDVSLQNYSPSLKNIHRLNGNAKDLHQEANQYRDKLALYLNRPEFHVVCFAGIGVQPAHLAFNDFETESCFQNPTLSEEEKKQLALQSHSRLITLSDGTRESNARFFNQNMDAVPKQALTIGFEEIFSCDSIVIMAGGASKKRALFETFSVPPSYTVPASLLNYYTQGRLSFIVDENSYGVDEPESLFSLSLEPPHSNIKIKKSDSYQLQFYDIPNLNSPALILNNQQNQNPKVQYVHLPSNKKVLWIKFGKTHYSLLKKLKKRGNQIEFLRECTPEKLAEKVDQFQPHLIVLPYEQNMLRQVPLLAQKAHSSQEPVLGMYYDVGASYSNVYFPLDKKELKKKIKALKTFHQSQSKRSNFDLITREMSLSKDPISNFLEPFTFFQLTLEDDEIHREYVQNFTYITSEAKAKSQLKKHSTFTFKSSDQVLAISPHPDDVEIGLGGLVSFLGQENIPLTIFNATSGNRALMTKSDLLQNNHLPEELISQIAKLPTDLIEDKALKSKARSLESLGALKYLNPESNCQQLDLPFYEEGHLSDRDKDLVDTLLSPYYDKASRLVFFLPHPIDQHKTHRQTQALFEERILHYFKSHPKANIIIAYYTTPWTGNWNLYDYSSHYGSKLHGLIGAEQLIGNGAKALDSDSLGGSYARRYRVFYFNTLDKQEENKN